MPDYQSDKKLSFLFFIETAGIRVCGLLLICGLIEAYVFWAEISNFDPGKKTTFFAPETTFFA